MANIPMKDIQFPGLDDTYTFAQVDATLTTQGKAADAKKTGDEISELKADYTQLDETAARIDGSYDTMTVGNAKQLTSNVGINDKAPYLFRTAGGANDIGDREEDTIVGGSVVHNQLVENGNFESAEGWVVTDSKCSLSVSDNVATITATDAPRAEYSYSLRTSFAAIPTDHKVFFHAEVKLSQAGTVKVDSNTVFKNPTTKAFGNISANQWTEIIWIATGNNVSQVMYLFPMALTDNLTTGYTWQVRNYYVSDLTAMFGSAIADYVYSLEQATAGAGIAWLQKYGFFTKLYYPYCEPTFKHVEGLAAHKMTGFNAWDEQWEQGTFNTTTGANIAGTSQIRSKNLIPILPQTNYFWKCPYFAWFIFYDANKNVIYPTGTSGDGRSGNSISFLANTPFKTPIDAWYCRFYVGSSYGGTYKNNICLHLRWDAERDGEYEAYKVNTYPLDDSLILMGIPKLDANNDLYYDGDTYAADGTVTRKYGFVDLGTLTWEQTMAGKYYTTSINTLVKKGSSAKGYNNLKCVLYVAKNIASLSSLPDKTMSVDTGGNIQIHDDAYTDAATFKAAMSGVYLLYELATPTTETADPFQIPQVVDDWGTEEYVYTDGAFPIPVGHDTFYAANLKAKLEMAPDSPGDGDGDYIVRQTNGLNEYVKMVKELPSAPTTDGSYHLEVTVASGTPTLTWVADE